MSVAWRACPRPAAWSAVPAGVDFGDGEAEFLELGDQFAQAAVVVEPGAVVGELVVGQDPGSGLAVFLAGPLVVGAVPLRGVGVAAAAAGVRSGHPVGEGAGQGEAAAIAAEQNGGYFGSGYGPGPITQSDLVAGRCVGRSTAVPRRSCWCPPGIRRRFPPGGTAAFEACQRGRKAMPGPTAGRSGTHAGNHYGALAMWWRAGWQKNRQQWARPGSAGPPRVAQDGIGGHASHIPKHDSGTGGTSPALDPTTCDHILQQAGGRY